MLLDEELWAGQQLGVDYSSNLIMCNSAAHVAVRTQRGRPALLEVWIFSLMS